MAGRFTVEAIFKAVDKLSGPVKSMGKRVARFSRSAERNLRRLNTVVNTVGRGLKRASMFGIGVATTGIFALTAAIRSFSKEADDVAKRSRLLEFDQEELQKWELAAGVAGMTSEQFSKSLEQFTKRVGEARAGTGSLVTLLKKQNPELLRQLINTKDNAKAFDIFIKALRETKGAQDQLALANAAGGRAAGRFTLLAKVQQKELDRLMKKAEENGVITKKQSDVAEEFNDQMLITMGALKGLRNKVLEPLLPVLTKLLDRLRDWVLQNKELISGKIFKFFKDIVKNWDSIFARFKKILTVAKWIAILVVGLKALILVLTVVNLLTAANPVTLIVLGIILLITVIVNVIIHWKKIVALFREAPIWVKAIVLAIGFLMGPLNFLIVVAILIQSQWEELKIFWDAFWIGMEKFPETFKNGWVSAITIVVNWFKSMFQSLPGPVQKVMELIGSYIKFQVDMVLKLVDGIQRGINKLKELIGLRKSQEEQDKINERISRAEAAQRQVDEIIARDKQARPEVPVSNVGTVNSTSEVVIKDDTGRAEITKQPNKQAGSIVLVQTGGF